jgi:hopene-associated glycosyltransferase HpnB
VVPRAGNGAAGEGIGLMLLASVAVLIWAYLLLGRGRFWRSGPVLPLERPGAWPSVAVVVPARDEAPVIARSLGSLLAQRYSQFRVILVDDGSTDGTGAIARRTDDPRLTVLSGTPPPAGWSGKLWALSQGIARADEEFVLLTDADIVHDPGHLASLVAKAEAERLDLVSEMVRLHCASPAERMLIPAFVYFFQLLYPFTWVNDPLRPTAAAAGGTILVRRRALERIGGIAAIRGALIDDVALAGAVKRGGRIWLGHSALASSVRAYPSPGDIWAMIARTAFVQLRYSWTLVGLTTLGMAITFVAPPVAMLFGQGAARWLGLLAWIAESASYVPTLRRFGVSPLRAPLLPLIALFYMAATIGSAARHGSGRGLTWKQRAYVEKQI